MRIPHVARLCACLLGILLFWTAGWAESAFSSLQPQPLGYQQILQGLAIADVIYLGETHDRLEDHQAQLTILQKLDEHNCQQGKATASSCLAIAMEMFQRPYQDIIDQYLAGNLTEQQLVEQTEYERRWGFPWEYYAPILRFAKERQLPVLALNTPTEVTRKVAREGLESLTPADKKYIPPLSEIRTDNAEYRQRLLDIYKQHQTTNHHSKNSFERFFTTQVLWDETMADRIAQFLKIQPTKQLVVLAGQGHIVYGYGIPSRVTRRLNKHGKQDLVQRSVLLSPPEEDLFSKGQKIADFVWQSE